MAHSTAVRFKWISTAFVVFSVAMVGLVSADAMFGLGLGFTLKAVPVALFIVLVATLIRVAGVWFMRLTGGLD